MRSMLLALSAAATLSFAGIGAQAMPAQAVTGGEASPHITLVAQGCGPGFHLGPGGACRPNRGGVVVVRPGPAVVVRPGPAVVVRRPAVVVRPGCGVRVGPVGVRTPC